MTNKCLLPKRRLSSKTKDLQNNLNSNNISTRQPSSATTHRTPVVLFRKIINIKSSCETIQPNRQFDTIYPTTATVVRNPNRSSGYQYRNTHQSESPKHQAKNQQKFLSLRQSLALNDDLRKVNNTPIEPTETESDEAAYKNNEESNHDNCLFCRYEKAINNNKLPKFATKRMAKIFLALTKNPSEANKLKNEKTENNAPAKNVNEPRVARVIRIPNSNERGSISSLRESSASSF